MLLKPLLTFLLLTYMATIAGAINNGILEEFALPEWEAREPLRPLRVAPGFFDWADEKPEMIDEGYSIGGRCLLDHLEQMLCDFRCAKYPAAGDLRRVMPTKHGIWKAHAPALRIYGWFCAPRRFVVVVVAGALEEETKKDKTMNSAKLDEVRSFIAENDLGKTVLRGDHRAIIQAKI